MAAKIIPLLKALVKQKGSDLHIAAGSFPMLRLQGSLLKLDLPSLTDKDVENYLQEILTSTQKKQLVENKSIDLSIKVNTLGVFRVNAFYQRHGLAAVFRALPIEPPSFEDLQLPQICKLACNYPNGLVLVTGPTGSGKSTTLASMINYINQNLRRHIITLEDPIEFHHDTQRCMVNQRQLGTHFKSFSQALRSALREDPDVILVGEMRDIETIQMAISAAETGHLVFGTLHTNSAPKSLDRILDSFDGNEQQQIRSMLSESLRVILSQKLIPSADGKSRIAIHDILVNNPAISNLIRENKTHQILSIMQTGRREGMQIFDHALLDAVKKQAVTGADAWNFANNKAMFKQWAPHDMQIIRGGTNLSTIHSNKFSDKDDKEKAG